MGIEVLKMQYFQWFSCFDGVDNGNLMYEKHAEIGLSVLASCWQYFFIEICGSVEL